MTEEEFNEKYWLTNLKIAVVVNPLTEDYKFGCTVETGIDVATGKAKVESREYVVKAGGKERFPAPVANIYLSQMSRLKAQEDDKFPQYIDYAYRASVYDDLIVEIIDMVDSYQPFDTYNKEEKAVEEKIEKPFENVTEGNDAKPGRTPKAPVS